MSATEIYGHNIPEILRDVLQSWMPPPFVVEQIEAVITDLEQAGWVSVDERLPRLGLIVLAWEANLNEAMRGERVHCRKLDKPIWASPHGLGMEVSHWMPLPEPPE